MINTFGKDIIPANDKARLKSLYKYKILDSAEEASFNHIASIIAKVFNVPIALISFVGEQEVFFKARYGFKETHADRGVSLCALAVLDDGITVFENPKEEPCLLSNPLVQGHFGLAFYAGAPLKSRDGFNIGTVCIVDKKQRFFSKDQSKLLEEFSQVIMDLLEMRAELIVKKKSEKQTAA